MHSKSIIKNHLCFSLQIGQ